MTAAFIAVWVKEAATKLFAAIWASFVALFASQAVWLAALCIGLGGIFLGGFWFGHIKGTEFARSRAPAAFAGMSPAVFDPTAYERKIATAEGEAGKWKEEAAAKQKEVARLTAELGAKSDALTALQKRLATRVAVPKKAATEPAKAAWTPFER